MSAAVSQRPSDHRRRALREADSMGVAGVPMVSNFFPIERYYDAAGKVLVSFHAAYNSRRLDDAYVYGKRFMTFSLDALPQHNYFHSPKYAKIRARNKKEMEDVIQKLEQVALWMDEEERKKQLERKRQEEERRRRIEEEEQRRVQEFQRHLQMQKKRGASAPSANVQQSALDKLNQLNGLNAALPQVDRVPRRSRSSSSESGKSVEGSGPRHNLGSDRGSHQSQRQVERGSSRHSDLSNGSSGRGAEGESAEDFLRRRLGRPTTTVGDDGTQDASDYGKGEDLPPPLAPPPPYPGKKDPGSAFPPPPSYSAVMEAKTGRKDHQHLPVHSGFPPSAAEQAAGQRLRPPTVIEDGPTYANRQRERERLKAREKQQENVPFRKLREKYVMDYNRMKASKRIEVLGVNTHQGRLDGSTNGCAVISPLVVSHHLRSSSSVTDSEIVSVIDRECIPLLREIRGKLGLGGAALIIPSDVHDHLVDKKVLHQNNFVGATGGNIMDKAHTGEFFKLLEHGENKTHTNKKTGAALFFREHVVSVVKVPVAGGKFYYDLVDSLPGVSDNRRMMATRTRCKDMAAFEALVRWYAATKFSESNMTWIDRHEWDETMADFDPRVFQAFVWGEP